MRNVEYINFDRDLIFSKGKGYCEIQMINYALEGLDSCDFFVKITGRYSISNWNTILKRLLLINNSPELLGTEEINFISNQFSSRLFFISFSYWRSKFVQFMLSKVDDNNGYFIEHSLYNLSLYTQPILLDVVHSNSATSATTSRNLRENPIKQQLKSIIYFFLNT